MLATAGGLLGFNLLFQAADGLLCGGCASGVLEHGVAGVAIGLAAGGGTLRGGAVAYDHAVMGRRPRDIERLRRTGIALVAIGAVATIVNDAMWFSCVLEDEGPYASDFSCRYGLSRLFFDLGTGSVAAGGAMIGGTTRYRQHSAAYARGRVISVLPKVGPRSAGLQIGGRF